MCSIYPTRKCLGVFAPNVSEWFVKKNELACFVCRSSHVSSLSHTNEQDSILQGAKLLVEYFAASFELALILVLIHLYIVCISTCCNLIVTPSLSLSLFTTLRRDLIHQFLFTPTLHSPFPFCFQRNAPLLSLAHTNTFLLLYFIGVITLFVTRARRSPSPHHPRYRGSFPHTPGQRLASATFSHRLRRATAVRNERSRCVPSTPLASV